MKILTDDWRFKVVFDPLLMKDLASFSFSLSPKEQPIFNKQVDFFKNNFSLDQVIDHLIHIKTEKQYTNFKKEVYENIASLIYCPKQLKSYYLEKIKNIDNKYHSFLLGVLQKAQVSHFVDYKSFYKLILGKMYGKTIKVLKTYAKRKRFKYAQTKLNSTQIATSLKEFPAFYMKSFDLQGIWGKFNKMDYNTFVNTDYGTGRWQSGLFTKSSDSFIVNTNSHSLTDKQLEFSYNLNVYPGLAHFYSTVLSSTFNNNFDSAATFVINGWSTFAAWHIKPNGHTRNDKIIKSKIVSFLIKKQSTKALDGLYLYLLSAYGKAISTKIFFVLTQYPTKFEDAAIGAVATELLIDNGFCLGPQDYLRQLKNHNVGNFFHTYNASISSKKKVGN